MCMVKLCAATKRKGLLYRYNKWKGSKDGLLRKKSKRQNSV